MHVVSFSYSFSTIIPWFLRGRAQSSVCVLVGFWRELQLAVFLARHVPRACV